MTTPTFGQWLRRRRKSLGLTQRALAEEAGCAEVTLRKIEAGDLQPSAPLVTSLAQALGVDEPDLPGLISLARGLEEDFTTKARLLRPQRPNNLPAQLTPLIGRSRDITAVRKRLLVDGARLVTLVGPPGVGKTRLSLAVAEDVLDQFDDGAFFVRLAPVTDPDQVTAAIAQTLGLQMSGPNPPELQLRAYLEEKHLLLVLDNFEQIVAAAPLVDDLLRRCPWLHVLVTSRQPLRVRGERQIHVRPLALPTEMAGASAVTAADMLRYPSVELFAERAEAVLPDFAVDDGNAAAVAELCRRLDGLPLAIELVAARVKLLPPAELLQRLYGPWLLSTDGLRDVSARQKTLRGAISWSYDLLSPAEQTLFICLSVFVGGCTLQTAEMMCADFLTPAQVLDYIALLLDKNLLHRETGLYGEPRYVMFETVREYGLEHMARIGGETVLRDRHGRSFLHILETADQSEINPGKPKLNRLIDSEIHNLRAALNWFMQQDAQAALTLAARLLRWYSQRGPYVEGIRIIDKLFALPGTSASTVPRAAAMFEAGILLLFSDNPDKAQAFEEESLFLSQELGYSKGEADALLGLGRISFNTGDAQSGGQYLERALVAYRKIGDSGGICRSLAILSEIALYHADYISARTLCEESLLVAQKAGFVFAWPLSTLGSIASGEGKLEQARSLHEQRLVVVRQDGNRGSLIHTLTELGIVAIKQGDLKAARVFIEEALEHANGLGNRGTIASQYVPLAMLCQAEGNIPLAIKYHRKTVLGADTLSWMWVPFLICLADLAQSLGQHLVSAKLLGAIDVANSTIIRLFPDERHKWNRLANAARSNLGETCFDTAWTEGKATPIAQTAEEAISTLEKLVGVKGQSDVGVRHA